MNAQTDQQTHRRKLIIGLSGASGAILGIRMLEVLNAMETIETHVVISPSARMTIHQETDWQLDDVLALADVVYKHQNIAASIASGSFDTSGMVIIPCSIKTLSAVANSYSENLLSRAADVTLKEGRPLVLVVREAPLHRGHLRLMSQAAEAGAVIFPPVPVFYSKSLTFEELIDNIIGRVLTRLGVENELYAQWSSEGYDRS